MFAPFGGATAKAGRADFAPISRWGIMTQESGSRLKRVCEKLGAWIDCRLKTPIDAPVTVPTFANRFLYCFSLWGMQLRLLFIIVAVSGDPLIHLPSFVTSLVTVHGSTCRKESRKPSHEETCPLLYPVQVLMTDCPAWCRARTAKPAATHFEVFLSSVPIPPSLAKWAQNAWATRPSLWAHRYGVCL